MPATPKRKRATKVTPPANAVGFRPQAIAWADQLFAAKADLDLDREAKRLLEMSKAELNRHLDLVLMTKGEAYGKKLVARAKMLCFSLRAPARE